MRMILYIALGMGIILGGVAIANAAPVTSVGGIVVSSSGAPVMSGGALVEGDHRDRPDRPERSDPQDKEDHSYD